MPQRTKQAVSAIAAILFSVLGQNALVRANHPLPADNHVSVSKGNRIELQLDLPIGQNRDALAGANVTIVDRNGVATKYTADTQGVVKLSDLAAGPYAVVASSGNVYGSTIVMVHAADTTQATQKMMRMPLAVVNTKKLAPWMETFVAQLSKKQAAQLGEVMTEIQADASPFDYRVQLRDGGVLEGHLVSILNESNSSLSLADTEVILMQNGIPVGKTTTNSLGEFQFTGVRTGVHGIVAAGPAGYATFAFEVVEKASLANENSIGHKFVSYASADLKSSLPVTLVPPSMIPGVVDPFGTLDTEIVEMQPTLTSTDFSGGGMSGGAFGGGGSSGGYGGSATSGGGGSGGIGGLGLLGVAAAIAIPIAVSDSDAGPVASPSGN